MLASGLKTTRTDAVRYFRTEFVPDLTRVAGADGQRDLGRLSVASFCPDYPKAQIYSGPAQAFAHLSDQRWFLGCLLVTQLAAQASHSKGEQYYFGPPVVLAGLLGSYWSVVHPGFLLLVLALYREAVEAPETAAGLQAILRSQIDDIHNLQPLTSQLTLGAMRAGLRESELPTSLRPFVPSDFRFSPDESAVRDWHACLCQPFDDAAA